MKSNQETKLMSKSNTRKVLKDFCESTSLHGYGYIYNNDSIVLKLFWLFVIFSMTGLGILLLVQNTIEFLEHEIYTTTETSSAPISVSKYTANVYRDLQGLCGGFLQYLQGKPCNIYRLQGDCRENL